MSLKSKTNRSNKTNKTNKANKANNEILETPSIFVTNNDIEVNIIKEETLNEQMNGIFTKYLDIKKKFSNLKIN